VVHEQSHNKTAHKTAPNGWPRALLQGFRAGERQALTTVYREHADDIARMLRRGFVFSSAGKKLRFVGYSSGFELHDALHETFRRAFEPRARDGYDGIRPYRPYLRTIARNIVLQTFRAREVVVLDEQQVAQEHVHTLSGAPANPEATLAKRQLQARVQGFLATLNPPDRQLLELRFVEGHSQRDVAKQLGLSRQRLRTREAKLRIKLLTHLRATPGSTSATLLLPLLAGDGLLRTCLDLNHTFWEVVR